MKAKPTVLVVEPPAPSVAGKYLLAVTRPGNIAAGPSLIFVAADEMRKCGTDEHALEALRAGDVVARFPTTLPYLLIERGATRFVTQVAIAKYEKALSDRIRKIYGGQILTVDEAAALLGGHVHKHGKEGEPEEDTRPMPGQYA